MMKMYLCILYLLYCHLSVATVFILIGIYIIFTRVTDWLNMKGQHQGLTFLQEKYLQIIWQEIFIDPQHIPIYTNVWERVRTCELPGLVSRQFTGKQRLVCPLYSLKMLVTAYVCISCGYEKTIDSTT